MGFSTIASQIIFIFLFIVVFATFITLTGQSTHAIDDAKRIRNDIDFKRSETKMQVQQVNYVGGFIHVQVKNAGSTIIDTAHIDIYRDNHRFSRPFNTQYTLDLNNQELFEPGDIFTFVIKDAGLPSKTYRILLTTAYGTSTVGILTI